jgi:pyruvate ferredoxin oxidoreductase beta subunit
VVAYNLKNVATKPERLTGGHRMCAGCGAPVIVRHILKAIDPEVHAVISCATGCLEVSTVIYPYSSWKDSFIHSAFENSAATISGVEAAYRRLKRKGKVKGDYKFIAFGGDGGTYDIGLQSLSGAMERGHQILYVCYDNGAYMNTGVQRSSATPMYADTTTSPAGKEAQGKQQWRKDLTEVLAAHNIPYVCQTAAIGNMKDIYIKAEKALNIGGPAFMNVLSPCPRGWQYNTPDLMKINRLAVDTCIWPLYEIENGSYTLNYKPRKKLPVEDFLKPQGRFKHLFKPENEHLIKELQEETDKRWNKLIKNAEQ